MLGASVVAVSLSAHNSVLLPPEQDVVKGRMLDSGFWRGLDDDGFAGRYRCKAVWCPGVWAAVPFVTLCEVCDLLILSCGSVGLRLSCGSVRYRVKSECLSVSKLVSLGECEAHG